MVRYVYRYPPSVFRVFAGQDFPKPVKVPYQNEINMEIWAQLLTPSPPSFPDGEPEAYSIHRIVYTVQYMQQRVSPMDGLM